VNTIDRLRRFIREELGWNGPPAALTPDLNLLENGVLDSLGIFQTVGFLEDEYGVEVQDNELVPENFATLASIAALLESKGRQQA
jgi:acyl carrier protein